MKSFEQMDPKYTAEILEHLEKQNDLLMDAYGSMSHELHKLQVEEEMLMHKFYEFTKAECQTITNDDKSNIENEKKTGESSEQVVSE